MVRESRDTIRVRTVHGKLEVPICRLDEFLRYNGHADYLLDQSVFDNDKVFDKLNGDYREATVYYGYVEESTTGRAFLSFYTFYAFDPKSGVAKAIGLGPHVFDRESVMFEVGEDGRPMSMVLSGHLRGQRITFLDSPVCWTEGRVRMPFPAKDAATVNGHAIAFAAEGSHALYPCPGIYEISALKELAGQLLASVLPYGMRERDSAGDVLQDHQTILPPAFSSDRFSSYNLLPLRFDLLRSDPLPASELYDPSTAALVFSGYWVDVPGFSNERFPPFALRETQPAAWVDGAYQWDWGRLPRNMVEHNAAMVREIGRGLRRGAGLPDESCVQEVGSVGRGLHA
jgi:hypothetical protein